MGMLAFARRWNDRQLVVAVPIRAVDDPWQPGRDGERCLPLPPGTWSDLLGDRRFATSGTATPVARLADALPLSVLLDHGAGRG